MAANLCQHPQPTHGDLKLQALATNLIHQGHAVCVEREA
jgi:hypothetical protein